MGKNFSLGAVLASLALVLLAIVDFRRGFLFSKWAYLYKSAYIVFSPWQLALISIGLIGLSAFRGKLNRPNREAANFTLIGIFFLLLIDAGLYRGVAAARSLNAGSIGTDWLKAYGAEGVLRPLALSASYVLTVWHATVLSSLGAGLALLALPRILDRAITQKGWRGSLAGTVYSLTQPFCSCCVALTSPGLFRANQSMNFATAVLLGAPLLNISTLILAGNLLPWPFATLRILGGVLVTIFLSLVLSKWITGNTLETPEHRLASTSDTDNPSLIIGNWLKLSARIALVLIPSMVLGAVLAAVAWSFWPTTLGNSITSVILTSLVGSLVMVSTWSEIPLASQMLHQGMTGPAAAALLALPSVNLGSLLIIGKVSRNWRLAAGLGLGVMLVSCFVGLAFL